MGKGAHMPRGQDEYRARVRPTDLNFMVVKGRGKVRRFKISSRFLGFSFVFFLVYIVASLFAVNGYLSLRMQIRQQAQRIAHLNAKLISANNKLYEAKQRIALLEHPIIAKPAPQKATELSPAQVTNKDQIPVDRSHPKQTKPEEVGDSQTEPKSAAAKQVIEIRDLRLKLRASSLDLAFKVYKNSDAPGPVKGYVHMIWIQESSDLTKAWSWPNIALTDGLPVDYKTGRLFSIRHFREMRASFERKPDRDLPRILRIVAFSKSGEEIFLKDYNIKALLSG